jgi:hypothetical protein
MRGTGLTIILIPDFVGESGEGLAWDVPIAVLEFIEPDYEFVSFVLRQYEIVFLQFSKTHQLRMPRLPSYFKPETITNVSLRTAHGEIGFQMLNRRSRAVTSHELTIF